MPEGIFSSGAFICNQFVNQFSHRIFDLPRFNLAELLTSARRTRSIKARAEALSLAVFATTRSDGTKDPIIAQKSVIGSKENAAVRRDSSFGSSACIADMQPILSCPGRWGVSRLRTSYCRSYA